ncbi:RRQRL motif-containing zinc-binding protein [Asanoa sp. NPDC049518]|uniref:RRQRL motif-containing zinc-binding protein n=1 Tax=unclassified Asanoa TaxID=2685164 RepID=UPI00344A5358
MTVPFLNQAIARGTFVEFYDPTAQRFPIPTYPYRWAPQEYVTRRQLRSLGLRPGGQDIAAQILWRRGKRVAFLYRLDLAKPKRPATPAQLAAVAKALLARRTCGTCHQVKPYYIPRRYGECLDCYGGH